jgi:hypothetical protein
VFSLIFAGAYVVREVMVSVFTLATPYSIFIIVRNKTNVSTSTNFDLCEFQSSNFMWRIDILIDLFLSLTDE